MTEVINVSTNISSSLLLKSHEFTLQSYSNAVKEIARQMNVEFIDFNGFGDVNEIRSDLYGDEVRKAIWKEKSKPVILRTVPGYSIEDHHRKLIEEIRHALQNRTCENIIQLLGVTEDPSDKSAILVIQHPNDGTLREYLAQHPDLGWLEKFNLAKNVAEGIRHLHRSGIIHGDLHAQSVFIDDGKAVIRDPGLFSFEDDETSSSSSLNSAILSTIPYVDPQVMGDMKHKPDQHSDIYSLGVIMWEISSCAPPFGKSGSQVILTMSIMVRKTREQPVPNTPEEYVQLYQQCWDHEPKMRPNIERICDQLDGFLYDEPIVTGKSLTNSVVIADIRASSEESRKSHNPPSSQNSQNEVNQKYKMAENEHLEKPSPLQRPESKYQDANLSEPISPTTLAQMDKEFEESGKPKIIKFFKSKISKISKTFKKMKKTKKMSCFS